jgi:hypothetical protein
MKMQFLTSTAAFSPPGENGGAEEGETVEQETDVGEVPEGEEGQDEPAQDEGVDGEGEEAEEVDAEPARRPSRAQSRIQTLTQTLKEEKAERQRIDRELADLRASERQRQAQSQQETPEAKAARRALMDPMDVMREDLRESEQRTQNLLHQQALATQETQDKLLYNSILRDAPHLKKYDGEVEKIRLEQQSKGIFVPREVLLDLAIGRAARAAATKAAPKAKAKAAAQVAAQQSRPAASRGDAATQRGKQGDSVEKRLENVPI